MSNEAFDPSLYTSPPRMTLESGIALARALVAACPQSMPARIHKAAKKLAQATKKLALATTVDIIRAAQYGNDQAERGTGGAICAARASFLETSERR